jgi:UDP-N-acetyl-alpha-D-muramoyl-L-alanyl-L-glutamate epimerase
MQLSQLRSQHPTFTYLKFKTHLDQEQLVLEYTYLLEPDIEFKHQVLIPGVSQDAYNTLEKQGLAASAFNIGLVEMLSYWKAACPSQVVIKAGYLSDAQQAWWLRLWLQGLGEFWYVNQLDPQTTLPELTIDPAAPTFPPATTFSPNSETTKYLIPVGGGKDSVVSLELLKKWLISRGKSASTLNEQLATLHLYPTLAAQDTARVSQLPAQPAIQRHLDPLLLELNRQGYLNGHVPFSASLAFISVLAARLWGFDSIVLSNEFSSSEGNVWYHDIEINHQYSKGSEFEKNFQSYVASYIQDDSQAQAYPYYFSLLRPLYEFQIAAWFSQWPEYWPVFRSCNKGRKNNTWCGTCPKCVFTHLILAPFMNQEQLSGIFGHSLWDDPTIIPHLQALVGLTPVKPLECVGTRQESSIALGLIFRRYEKSGQVLPPVLAALQSEFNYNPDSIIEEAQNMLKSWRTDHQLSPELAEWLQTETQHLAERIQL